MNKPVTVLSKGRRRALVVPEIGYILGQLFHYSDARDCIDVPFEHGSPVRQFPNYRGKRNYTGKFWSLTTGGHIPFESLFERTALLELDRDPSVAAISSQPMWIFWPKSEGGRSHAPDFFVRQADGHGTLVDVRPRSRINPETAEVFEATRSLCEKVGFGYKVICDLDPMLDKNLSAILRYRNDVWRLPDDLWAVVDSSGPTCSLRDLAGLLEPHGGQIALGWVYWLLWHGVLQTDLRNALSLDTEVTVRAEGQQ